MFKNKIVFGAACIGMLLFGITLITLGAVVPQLNEKFQLNEISSGTLFSILPFGVLTGSLIFGPICDKYGYKMLMVVSCICMFIGFEGIAYAPDLSLLKICIYLFGLGGGAINGATNALVAEISDKNKGANLSLLGVFFGIGALGMPFVLGLLEHIYAFDIILALVGGFTFAVAVFFTIISFPPAKQISVSPIAQSFTLVKDNVLILIALFLFCQCSFEAICNNWTTTYLSKQLSIPSNKTLYALSLFVVGMTVMRLMLGRLLRSVSAKTLLYTSLVLLLSGSLFLAYGNSYSAAVTGFILLGAGLAGGFPIMLGLVGNRYTNLSATAFSFVLFIALTGNIIINYLMGIIAHDYGIHYLVNVLFVEIIVMTILSLIIFNKLNNTTSKN
jgi:FHS family glucose/mannose:H+ symporter-like MFS transporter